MRIIERRLGDVTVVEVFGRMTLTDCPGRIKDKVTSLVFQGRRQIVINLANVTYVDSSGLGELVACHLTAVNNGCGIKIASAGTRTRELLSLTRLNTIFECYDTEVLAIDAFMGVAA